MPTTTLEKSVPAVDSSPCDGPADDTEIQVPLDLPGLLAALEEEDPRAVTMALYELSMRYRYDVALPVNRIVRTLQSRSEAQVRLEAVVALGRIPSPVAVEGLIDALTIDDFVQEQARMILHEISGRDSAYWSSLPPARVEVLKADYKEWWVGAKPGIMRGFTETIANAGRIVGRWRSDGRNLTLRRDTTFRACNLDFPDADDIVEGHWYVDGPDLDLVGGCQRGSRGFACEQRWNISQGRLTRSTVSGETWLAPE